MEFEAQEAEANVDRSSSKDHALKSAILAAELYMRATKLASSDGERVRLRAKCKELLTRAEEIKQSTQWPPRKEEAFLKAPVSERVISRREELILLEGSKLNGFVFPQWTSEPEDTMFDRNSDGLSYTEPAELKLSSAQGENFKGWRRPNEQGKSETLGGVQTDTVASMAAANDVDLVQDITTDCSVVASLCACTARVLKGHGKLLASIMYPYDRLKALPRVSDNGKYIFRLHFNGCFRMVTIDDRLPASNSARSLHVIDRNNPFLLWPALVEKAYLKVRGGYDFPGSNSGTDLWVLTGWIPEQVFLRSDDIQTEKLWSRIHKSFGFGDVMITLGTGKLSHKEEKELGLAGEHDYAVLDMRAIGSQRLMLVKNPWCDGMVWKGSLSENLVPESWTQEFRQSLPGQSITAGTFWMSFEDIAQHFESLYLNWNPGLFRHRQDHHFSWTIPKIKSPGSFIHNPQYAFKSGGKGVVWVLLSRHFATGEQDIVEQMTSPPSNASNALGFISVYVFEADGQRVYLSDNAIHRGAYVDSPQTLARMDVSQNAVYTIVVAQHGLPLPSYSFTLSFFSRFPLNVEPAQDRLSHCTSHAGAWTLRTSGGNASAESYPMNPQFSIFVSLRSDIVLTLETDQEELAVHVKMVWGDGKRVTAVTARDIVGGSGDYRRGCALATLNNVAAGRYTIVCSTFEPGQLGNFTLRVGSMAPCEVKKIPAEAAGRLSLRLPPLVFQDGCERMLAPLTISRMTRLRVVARPGDGDRFMQSSRSRPLLKICLERGQGPNKTVLDVSGNGQFSDAPMGIRTADLDVNPVMGLQGGLWIVVERLGGGSSLDSVLVEILSDSAVSVGLWGTGDG